MNPHRHKFAKLGEAKLSASCWLTGVLWLVVTALCLLTFTLPAATFTNNARIEITDGTGSLRRSAANGPLTVMCWFKFSIPSGVSVTSDMTVLVNQTGSTTTDDTHSYNIYFNASSGSVDFTARGGSGLFRQTLIANPFIDRWYHVAIAMSGSGYDSYVDGKLVSGGGTGSSGNTSGANGVSIGGWGAARGLWGEVQEVAIYQFYLSAGNIQTRMFKDLRNPLYTNNLVGYYKLAASTNNADWLKNFAPAPATGTDPASAQPNLNFLAFEETDQAGEQSLYDSRKNHGADAIIPLSGAFTWSQTAFARPTPGIGFTFDYAYSSALPPDGGSGDPYDNRSVGRGWRHSFDVRLARGESSTVLNLITWDGATEVWDRSPTNTTIYGTRHKEYRGELVKLTDGTDDHEWTTSSRLVYRFKNPDSGDPNMDGRLLEIRDYNSNHVQITWNEGLGNITKVTDTVGGNYDFNYDFNQLLTNISFQSWQLNFTQDPTSRRLLSKTLTNTSGLYTSANTTWQFQYANPSNGPLVRIIDPRGNTNTLVQYDQYGRQTNQLDALGRATATRYGVPGKRQITHIDPGTNSWVETYDRKGHILAQQDPLANVTSYTYDTNGNRISITEPLGWTTFFGYDNRANAIARTNALGEITRWAFHSFFNKATNEVDALGWTNIFEIDDTTGNLVRHYDGIGDLVRYTYRTNGLVSSSIDGNGNTNRFIYDTNGFLVARIDAVGFTNIYTYNEVGWKFSETNPLGEVATFAYDLNGNSVLVHDVLGRDFIKSYDPLGNLLAFSDGKSGVDKRFTTNTYDAANQRINTTDRTGTNTTFFSYTSRGELDRITNALGFVTANFYDAANRLIAVSDPLGNTITNVYDANGNKTALIDQLGQRWAKTYDRLNRILYEADPLGDTRQTTYDPVGRIKTITTPRGFVTTHDYDGRGRLSKWVDAENFQWLYGYDEVGNITNITDALNGHYVMAYSNRNERILERNQDGFEWQYTYDPLVRLKTQRDPNGTTRTLDYDSGGRVMSVTFNTGRVNAFAYDDNNNPEVLTRTGSGPPTLSQLRYDAMDRVTEYTDAFSKKVRYAYDALGRVSTLTYPDGKTLTHGYDAVSRLTNQVDWAGRELTYAYDKAGRIIRRAYPNGIVQTNTFDTAGQLTGLSYSPTVISSNSVSIALTYAYDRNGNKVGSTEKATLDWPMPSLRDETSRFTASGRITNRVDALGPTNNFTYQYDASGNMTNAFGGGQTWALTYDEDNRTTSIHWDCGITAKNITNRYDALGRRIAKTADGDQTRFVLDLAGGMERILCDMNGAGVITAWYVHGPDLCYKVDATNGLTCYHSDAQANIVALTDSNTNIVAQYAYTPYGRSLSSTNFQSQISNPYLFVGSQGVMEELPGLYFMRARYYSADAGVFLSIDPVKNIGPGWKPVTYGYVAGRPLQAADPGGTVTLFFGSAAEVTAGGYTAGGSAGFAVSFDSLVKGDFLDALGTYTTESGGAGVGLESGFGEGEVGLYFGPDSGPSTVKELAGDFKYGSASVGAGGGVSGSGFWDADGGRGGSVQFGGKAGGSVIGGAGTTQVNSLRDYAEGARTLAHIAQGLDTLAVRSSQVEGTVQAYEHAKGVAKQNFDRIEANYQTAKKTVVEKASKVKTTVTEKAKAAGSSAKQSISSAVSAVKSFVSKIFDGGKKK